MKRDEDDPGGKIKKVLLQFRKKIGKYLLHVTAFIHRHFKLRIRFTYYPKAHMSEDEVPRICWPILLTEGFLRRREKKLNFLTGMTGRI